MQAIFDLPVIAPVLQEKRRIGQFAGQTGDGVLDFDRRAAIAGGRAFETENLGQARPIEMFSQSRAGLEIAKNDTAMPLVARARLRKRRLTLFLGSGGKDRVENPRPPQLSTRADYP